MSMNAALAHVTEDPVRDYLQKIGKIPVLEAQDEIDLARRIEAGVLAQHKLDTESDPEFAEELRYLVRDGNAAYSRFVRSNLKLVVTVAKRFAGHGVPFMDLIQEGNIGLDHAIKKFDYRQGYKFSTYAMWWIRQAIGRGLSEGRIIRVPLHTAEKITSIRRAHRTLETSLGRRPTVEELALETGFTEKLVRRLLDADIEPVSISTPIGDDNGSDLGELIEDDDCAPVVDIVEASMRHDLLRKKVASLPRRESEILRMRFGLEHEAPMTSAQIGKVLGVSRERVRQIEQRALRMLRCRELS